MIFVTGGTGLLGSQLIYDLVKKGEKVRALKRPSSSIPGKLQPLISSIEWVNGDVLDIGSLEECMQDVTSVYHCAAEVSFAPGKKKQMMSINVEGTANIVNTCLYLGVKKLLHVSSITAIGAAKKGEYITEENQWEFSKALSDYSVSKHEAEREAWRGYMEGLDVVIVNPSVILGFDKSNSLYNLIKLGAKGIPFYSDGMNGMVDVKDVSEAMIRLMNSDISGERFIVSSENIYFREVQEIFAECFSVSKPTLRVSPFFIKAAWRAEQFISLLTGMRSRMSRSMTTIVSDIEQYSNKKIIEATGMKFIPVRDTIKQICMEYKEATK